MLPLDPEEQAILESVENDEWNSVPDQRQEIQRYQSSAQAHSAPFAEVKIEIPAGDLRSLQALAQDAGLSVPTFVAGVLRQYVSTHSHTP
jgi:predicted DNA binding CopG/RHH family protein